MPRIIGMIGGLGPWASIYMMQLFYRETKAAREQDYPRILLDSNPQVPDRTLAILGKGEDPYPCFLASARGLADQGAELLVMACNTAHYWHNRLKDDISIPFPSLITCAVESAINDGMKAGETLGLMATDGLLATHLYQKEIESRGLQVRLPGAVEQQAMMEAIYGPQGIKLQGIASPGGKTVKETVQNLLECGCSCVITACTELPVGLGDDPLKERTIDPMLATVRHVLRTANSKPQVSNQGL